jgi:hypothetical protein
MPKLSELLKKLAPVAGGHGLLARVDEVGVDLRLGREGADAEQPVLGLQPDVDAAGMWLATRVGMPMPRLTTKPSRSSARRPAGRSGCGSGRRSWR